MCIRDRLLHAALSTFNLGQSHNFGIVRTFVDTKGLSKGNDFQVEFVKALMKTIVVMPVISFDALLRMCKYKYDTKAKVFSSDKFAFDPSKVDNVLVEWMLALEALNNFRSETNKRIQAIYPIMMGVTEEEADGAVKVNNSLFESGVLSQLSTAVATATIQRCVEVLATLKIYPKDTTSGVFGFVGKSPKDIVEKMTTHNGATLGAGQSTSGTMIFDCAKACIEIAKEKLALRVALSSTTNTVSSPPPKHVGIVGVNESESVATVGVSSLQNIANMEVTERIKSYLQLDPNMKSKDVIKASIAELNLEEQTQLASLKAMKDKLNFIAKCLDLI